VPKSDSRRAALLLDMRRSAARATVSPPIFAVVAALDARWRFNARDWFLAIALLGLLNTAAEGVEAPRDRSIRDDVSAPDQMGSLRCSPSAGPDAGGAAAVAVPGVRWLWSCRGASFPDKAGTLSRAVFPQRFTAGRRYRAGRHALLPSARCSHGWLRERSLQYAVF